MKITIGKGRPHKNLNEGTKYLVHYMNHPVKKTDELCVETGLNATEVAKRQVQREVDWTNGLRYSIIYYDTTNGGAYSDFLGHDEQVEKLIIEYRRRMRAKDGSGIKVESAQIVTTEKQKKFVDLIMQGVPGYEAVKQAGYKSSDAKHMMGQPGVKKYMREVKLLNKDNGN